MKCLSIAQPWAWAIIHGPKRIENRTWATGYRGPLLIHASKSDLYAHQIGRPLNDGTRAPERADLVFGAIIGWARLTGCDRPHEHPGDPFAEGPWCWTLRDPHAFSPLPFRGHTGLFEVPDMALGDRIAEGATGAARYHDRSDSNAEPEPK